MFPVLTVLITQLNVTAETRYVWQESPSPAPPYTNWLAAAHTIQDAIDVAAPGDEVVVTNGISQTGATAIYGMRGQRIGVNFIYYSICHDDPGRDLVLYLGRKVCGLGYRELSAQAQIQYVSASTAVRRFAARVAKDRGLARLVERATRKMHNE